MENMVKKGLYAALSASLALVLLAACAGAPQSSRTEPRAGQMELIEHKGSAMGVAQPAWVEAAVQDDYAALLKDPRFEGKTPFVFNGQGGDLDLLQSWVNNFNASAAISRQISTAVNAKFAGGLQGDNNANKRQKLDEIVATISRTEINGLAREMDWWVLNRRRDTGAETYTYLVVYSISTEDLQFQVARAMGKIAAKTAEEQELVNDMDRALKELEFGGIIRPSEEAR